MTFSLHVDFAKWLDKESRRIVSLVQNYTDKPPGGGEVLPKKPDLPVAANIGPDDIIGEVIVSKTDLIGTLVTRYYQHQDRWLALAADGMIEARKLAERIWSKAELRDLLSRHTVEELLFEWVGDVVRAKSPAILSEKIERTVMLTVQELSVVILSSNFI
jgi:hypothetical protein